MAQTLCPCVLHPSLQGLPQARICSVCSRMKKEQKQRTPQICTSIVWQTVTSNVGDPVIGPQSIRRQTLIEHSCCGPQKHFRKEVKTEHFLPNALVELTFRLSLQCQCTNVFALSAKMSPMPRIPDKDVSCRSGGGRRSRLRLTFHSKEKLACFHTNA